MHHPSLVGAQGLSSCRNLWREPRLGAGLCSRRGTPWPYSEAGAGVGLRPRCGSAQALWGMTLPPDDTGTWVALSAFLPLPVSTEHRRDAGTPGLTCWSPCS